MAAIDNILEDMRNGLRTKQILSRYGLSMEDFSQLLKKSLQDGLISKAELKAWKARKPMSDATERLVESTSFDFEDEEPEKKVTKIETYVISHPETNNSWALQLFRTARDRLPGSKFKVNLHGRKYQFVVERLLFRGSVTMLGAGPKKPKKDLRKRQEEASAFIAKHGWSAYLEERAYQANFGEGADEGAPPEKAKLVLVHCQNQSYLGALHTPLPSINLYVGPSLDQLKDRISKTVDTRDLKF